MRKPTFIFVACSTLAASIAHGQFGREDTLLPIFGVGGEPSRVGYSTRSPTERYIYDNVPMSHDATLGVGHHLNPNITADFPFTVLMGGLTYGEALITLLPNAGVGFSGPLPHYLETIHFGVGHVFNQNVDVHHAFYDDLTTWEVGACRSDIRRRFLGGFTTSNIATIGPYAMVTIPGLSNLMIPIADNYLVYEQFITAPGTMTGDPDALSVFAGDATGCSDGANYIGSSDNWIYIDANLSGGIDPNEIAYHFGGQPFVANIYVSMSVIYCLGDVDFSGFVDLDDLSLFMNSFWNGC
jgi:hypothetical protein